MNTMMNMAGWAAQPKFKQICTPQQRWKKHLNIIKGNPNHVSVVIEKSPKSKLDFKKPYMLFGLEKNCTINQFRENIRKLLDLTDKDSLVLFCNRVIPNSNQRIKNLEKFIEPDGFIYFYISEQESFG